MSARSAFAVALFALVGARSASAQEPPPPAPPTDEVKVTPPPDSAGPSGPPPPPVVPPAEAAAAAEARERELNTEAPPPGPSGWKPGEGFILGSGDDFKLRIGFQGGYKFEPVYQDGHAQDRRAFFVLRPIMAGNFFKPWIRFWTSLELASNPPYVLDSYVELQPVAEFGARIGQQYTLISRHEEFGPQQILFPEWAPVAEYFWTGRDKGVTFWGNVADGLFRYYAGLYGGSPLRQFTTIHGNYVVEGRVDLSPLGAPGSTEFPYITDASAPFRISASVQGYVGKVQFAEENFNPSTFRFDPKATGTTRKQACGVVDLWLQGPWFALLVEGYGRRTNPDLNVSGDAYTSIGVWGQIGFLLIPRTLDLGLRGNWLNPSTTLSNDRFVSGEIQLAYYVMHTPNLVVKARYGYGDQSSPGDAALGAVPLFTKAGRIHIGTLQLNLAF
jgi:hypothetical protein